LTNYLPLMQEARPSEIHDFPRHAAGFRFDPALDRAEMPMTAMVSGSNKDFRFMRPPFSGYGFHQWT
jgi:hypothetical protein